MELGLDNEDSEHENDEDTNQSKTNKCSHFQKPSMFLWHNNDYLIPGSNLPDKEEDAVSAETGQNHPFFRRSDSMTFLGCIPPNPFDVPLAEAIPLADQPHLLQARIVALSICRAEAYKLHSK